MVGLIRQLRDDGNTVVVVEHERCFVDAADHAIDIGPGAGRDGGNVVFSGKPSDMQSCAESETAKWLVDEPPTHERNSPASPSSLILTGCRHHTLQIDTVEFPLGCLCVVTGVSGSGKSSLVEQTLYPALCDRLGIESVLDPSNIGEFESLSGVEAIQHVEYVDDQPIPASRRSNPATWLQILGDIRQLFSETAEARSRNLSPGHFSFNTDGGGRCPKCEGTGSVEVDMQFLADVVMTCPECSGSRYQRHILEVQYRGRSIADVLAITAAEGFAFFRGEPRIQKRLQSLREVGLDYLSLGQPLSTLSGGESQRLKLASSLAATSKSRSLLILNEPTTGLHPADVRKLLQCFDSLLAVGHSLIVIEHNQDIVRSADHIIELGPGAGPNGGRLIKP